MATRWSVASTSLMVVIALLMSCGAEKTQSPSTDEPAYRLYLSELVNFMIFSTRTGAVVDSYYFSAGARSRQNVVFTKNGLFKCTAVMLGRTEIWVENTSTGETLATRYTGSGVSMTLSADESILVVTGRGVLLLRMPHLDLIFEDEFGTAACLNPSRDQLFYVRGAQDSALFQVDFSDLPPRVSENHLRNQYGEVIQPIWLHCSPDAKFLLAANLLHGSYLCVFDLPSFSLYREFDSVFYAKIGNHLSPRQILLIKEIESYTDGPGRLDLLDLENMVISPFVSISQLPELDSHSPRMILYTPDQREGFLLVDGSPGAMIYKFEPRTMKLEKLIVRSLNGGSYGHMAIDPNPIQE